MSLVIKGEDNVVIFEKQQGSLFYLGLNLVLIDLMLFKVICGNLILHTANSEAMAGVVSVIPKL